MFSPAVKASVMSVPVVSVLLVTSSIAQIFGPRFNDSRFYDGPPRWGQHAQPQQQFFGHGPIKKDELEYQQQTFKQWWGDELATKLADLPTEGAVPEYRTPYAGHDYPDRAGGTQMAMWKYDQAFHRGRQLATQFERMDVSDHRNSGEEVVYGPWGRVRTIRTGGAYWYGHCNGWTAAAIRHAEPQRNVVRNGVAFTPADIKGLLAELYMYTDTEFLGGVDPSINPAVLHLTLGNWLGRGSYPIGMETAVGEVVINFPIFKYKTTIRNLSPRQAEVWNVVTYTVNINRELDKSPANYHRVLNFHYVLDLDADGTIRGGRYYYDSNQIDMLWAPLKPTQGGTDHNKRGNPHLDVKEVLAIWRESVAEDLRMKWLNIDPTDEDRILPPVEAVAVNENTQSTASEKEKEAQESTASASSPAAGNAPASGSSTESSSNGNTASTGASPENTSPASSSDSSPPANSATATASTGESGTSPATPPAASSGP
jgi:hypothetical protein